MVWSREGDKRFEEALVRFPEDTPERWEKIAEYLKMPVAEVMMSYEDLVHDIELIESDQISVDYSAETESSKMLSQIESKNKENERKRGVAWSPEEHGSFLEGLEKYGKGDWKRISRDFVRTRTATQVASHAQKYYERQGKPRKRSSIHDTTWVDAADTGTVPGSNLESMTKPHFDDQMPPEYSHDYFGL
ncbi:unnamed protein product [Microthlaspi erraticum]|uniref:HTH myb-type domain-containing protein n=1 Tax=Microthlaspi erraticum TaxID=1685480 RepID=A0A6D2I598_9BRAS|nr:unnamed protein product [Microthlaspi erraticum]